uniref:Uncharacterized protein n=1 Tax=Acrobeloides nanus TaxID=290746 RepID=A0A914E5H9_9BILA
MQATLFFFSALVIYGAELATAALLRPKYDLEKGSDNQQQILEDYPGYQQEIVELQNNPELQKAYYDVLSRVQPEIGADVRNNIPSDVPEKRAQTFVRFGKRAQTFVRFGKRAQTFVRFGRDTNKQHAPVAPSEQ